MTNLLHSGALAGDAPGQCGAGNSVILDNGRSAYRAQGTWEGFTMRRILFALLVLLEAAPAAAQQAYRLQSDEGRFSALLPGQPKYEAVPISNGQFTLHQWLWDTPDVAYLVSYIDYTPGHVARNGIQFVLNNLTKGLHGGRIPISERRITYAGYACRDVVVRTKDDRGQPDRLILRQRHMLVGDRAYIWNYVGAVGSESAPNVQNFFDSLALRN